MPRKRKTTATPVETPVSTEITTEVTGTGPVEPRHEETTPAVVASNPTTEELVVLTNSTAADAPPRESQFDTTTPTSSVDESAPEPQTERGRFRSWVTDTARGYSRLTDEQEQRLVVQFAQKPSADVLTALKGAGFHYHPDYAGQANAWVRQNDFEGRLQVDAIEKLIGSLPQRDSAAR